MLMRNGHGGNKSKLAVVNKPAKKPKIALGASGRLRSGRDRKNLSVPDGSSNTYSTEHAKDPDPNY